MKRLHKITLLAAWLFAFSIVVSPLSTEARDPFSPFSSSSDKKNKKSKESDKPSKEAETESSDDSRNPSISIRNPLTSAPLDNYKLAAVLLTPKDSFAVVKAANGMQYIARKNDRIGSEGGRITEITVDNIKVKHAEDEVKIPVSNFAEALSVEETEISPE